jgi:uncharacterized protein YfaS (alpha-2-macroglobulin family)
VEIDPLPQSEVGPKAAFTFYFNQAMERGSVQAALQAQPSVAGSFQWVNDATVKFTPDQALPLNTDLAVSLNTQARAANGLPLSAPVELSFRTTGGFSLADQLPRPGAVDSDPSSAVVTTFTRPIVALGADPKATPVAFTLEPASKGRGEWINTSTYIFYPDPPLLGGVEYTIRLNSGLTAADGSAWAPDQKLADWKFKTARPSVLTIIPDSKTELALDAVFEVTFNQPMDPASLQQNLVVKTPTGVPLAGKLSWNEANNQFTFKPETLLARSAKYTLTLSGKSQARGGAALGKDFSAIYTTLPDFGVRSSEPANRGIIPLYDVNGGVRIRFTAPLAKQDLTNKIIFQPAIIDPFISSYGDNEVYISGIFAPRSEYALTIMPGVQDKWGQTLKELVVLRFQTAAPQPALTLSAFLGDGTAFLMPRETAFAAQATNIKTLRVSYAALTVAEFAQNANISTYERTQKYSGPGLTTFEKKVELPGDKSTALDVPLNSGNKSLATGLYFYQIQSPEVNVKTNQSPNGVMLVVSRIHLALKRSEKQLTVWAVNLETNQPLAGASLAVFITDKNGGLTQAGTIKSDNQGLARLDYAFPTDTYTPIYVVVGKPGDPDFSLAMTTWTQGVNGWEFGLNSDNREGALHAYLYTERPIYRPGQVVDFRALVHQEDNGRYTPSDLKQITVKVQGEYSRTTGERVTIFEGTLPLSEYGAAAGSFALADSATPGYYTIEIPEVSGSYLSFQVANYRKPEVDVQVDLSAPDLLAGKDINGAVLARYYFGAPAANLNLHWTLYSAPSWFSLPEGFQNGPLDNGWLLPRWYGSGIGLPGMGTLVAEGNLRTTPDGRAAISVPAQKLLDAVDEIRTQQLILEVTLIDEQELPVSGRATAVVHPANLYLGVRADTWSGQVKQEAGFTVQTFDWKKAPVADRKLSALFQKVTYRQKANWNWQSNSLPYTTEYTKIGSADFQVDAQGRARIAFTPPEPGTYQIEVRGEGALSQLLFWVGGGTRAPWPVLADQHIRLVSDASDYQVGQTAKILIPNPLGEKTQAWITVERGRVMKTDVVQITGSSFEYNLALVDDYAPNVYVSVLLVETGSSGRPEFREGYIDLPVSPRAFQLQVAVVAQPETAAPGGDLRLAIQVKDAQGKPVQGEFSLAVVDKAVLALTEPNATSILESFYGHQPLGVSTSLSLAVYGRPPQSDTAKAAGGRGGGGGDVNAPVVRSEFRDTAYWSGKIVTDANGNAEITLKLPDNLTTWVVTARGLTREMRVGEATREVVVSKDLLIRPVTPRFLVAGDRVLLAATVNNNTAKAISAEVSLKAGGVDLENAGEATQKIELPAQGRMRVSWWAKVQNVDKVDLVFSAKGGGLEDASRPTNGSLPVVQYLVPQTFGTGGVLAEAGERLEVISAPRSFNTTAGELRVELSPSLAAAVLNGLKALESFPLDYAEPVMSRLLPNLEAYRTLKKLGIEAPEVRDRLEAMIQNSLNRLVSWQNQDGGWGWMADFESDPYLSAYILFGLSEAVQSGVQVDAAILKKGGDYLSSVLITPSTSTPIYQLDRLVFQYFALQQAGRPQKVSDGLYNTRQRLSPWAQALLALIMNAQNPSDTRARALLSDLQAQALRSATGSHWETKEGTQMNLGTPVVTTAVVSLALARLDPASTVLNDAVRYIMAHRGANGCWSSSYESAWVLMALTEAMSASGELSADFAYSAVLNGTPLASGKAGGPNGLTPVESRVPLSGLRQDQPNGLQIIHAAGAGRLYYRTFLQVYRPVEQATALNRGLTIARKIYLAGQDCTKQTCQPVSQVRLSDQRELFVRLTLTLPQAMYHLVVEDYIPAGAEIIDTSLKTVQKNVTPQKGVETPLYYYRLSDPFGFGWNWWLFGAPKVYDDHIRWMAPYLSAGTYELTYRLTPLQAGEFRLLPAHAYETYFPEVEGASPGAILRIDP